MYIKYSSPLYCPSSSIDCLVASSTHFVSLHYNDYLAPSCAYARMPPKANNTIVADNNYSFEHRWIELLLLLLVRVPNKRRQIRSINQSRGRFISVITSSKATICLPVYPQVQPCSKSAKRSTYPMNCRRSPNCPVSRLGPSSVLSIHVFYSHHQPRCNHKHTKEKSNRGKKGRSSVSRPLLTHLRMCVCVCVLLERMELYRTLSVGQEKEFVIRLTNREREEHCSSMSLLYSFLSPPSFSSWRTTQRGKEENPATAAAAAVAVVTIVVVGGGGDDETNAGTMNENRE